MTAGIEYGVEIIACDRPQHARGAERGLRVLVPFEVARGWRLRVRRLAARIDRRLPALWRSERKFHVGVLEDVVGRGELLQPDTGLLPGVAKPVVRRHHHQDSHCDLPGRRRRR
jgi:hypothetical protein